MRVTALTGTHKTAHQSAHSATDQEPAAMAHNARDRSLTALLELCKRYMTAADIRLITRAYRSAEAAHHGALRKSGEPFIEHPLAVARILAELAIDASGIAAALLHDTVEDTSLTLPDVQEHSARPSRISLMA